MKKLFIISILAIGCVNNLYAAGDCGIRTRDPSTNGTAYGYTRLNGNAGYNESTYGLITGSGQWAAEFSYGTVWGMANCNSTNGTVNTAGTPTLASSGSNCWCQATGFTASGNSYTSGPQCTTSASAVWVLGIGSWSSDSCARDCAYLCSYNVGTRTATRAAVFGAVPDVGLAWYDGNTQLSGGPSSCTVGGTFVPPTPPARPGYVFAGWRVKEIHIPCVQQIQNLDTSINGSRGGYINVDGSNLSYASNYGLQSNGQWATEFSYGTVWGMANCNSTNGGTEYTVSTPTLASSGRYCWCQVTGFTASGNSYTSGPQCTTAASSKWVFYGDQMMAMLCATNCSHACYNQAVFYEALREALYGAAE